MSDLQIEAEPSDTATEKPNWLLGRLFGPRFWQVLGLFLALLFSLQNLEAIGWTLDLNGDSGTRGAGFAPAPEFAQGYVRVTSLSPGGAMAKAGVMAGDYVRFDQPYDHLRRVLYKGEQVGFTLNRDGKNTHLYISAGPLPQTVRVNPFSFIQFIIVNLIHAGLGALLLWRGGRNLPTLLLGLALVLYSTNNPQTLESHTSFFLGFSILTIVCTAAVPVVLFAFAIHFREKTVGMVRPWHHTLLKIYGLLGVIGAAIFSSITIFLVAIPFLPSDYLQLLLLALVTLCLFGSLYVLFKGWLEGTAEVRGRYAILLFGIGAMLTGSGLGYLSATISDTSLSTAVSLMSQGMLGGIFPLLLVYAVLRHKVLDLGFAINRTLVYGTLSALLLVAFGFGEWAFEHYLPFKSHEASVLVDAGLAVAIFLVFHRVRDAVEHVIEKIFFHTWQQNEAALKRFVKQAGFVTKTDPLMQATIAELMRFTGGAEVALYLKDETDLYVRREGALKNAPETIDPDHPLLVILRAEREPLEPEPSQRTALIAALILPMVQRNEVTGFILLGDKPKGAGYRPDEIDILGWAAQHIGLDLHALRIEYLEDRVSTQAAHLQFALKAGLMQPPEAVGASNETD